MQILNKLDGIREKGRRKLQRSQQRRACKKTANPLRDYPNAIVTTFYDVEGSYAIPGKECVDMVYKSLEVEAKYGINSTYNVVARLAQEHPQMISDIRLQGSEVASHSFNHNVLTKLDSESLRKDVIASKEAFTDLGIETLGHRSPQSAWDSRLLKCLVSSGYAWSAEGGIEDHPYPIIRSGSDVLWRFPVRDDDWRYESDASTPSEMLDKWKRIVRDNAAVRRYTAIGFHPWVEKSSERFAVFEEFIQWLAELPDVDVMPFADVLKVVNTQSTHILSSR